MEKKKAESYPCPYCDDAPKKSKAGLAAHIRLKHPELSVQKEQEKKESPVENPAVKPVVLQREPPKQQTMGEEIEAQVIKENAATEAEKVEVVQEEKPPESGFDVMALLGKSGISVDMINAALSKAPIVAGLSVALKTVEQKLLDVVDVMSAMNEQMKPLLALYEHYKPRIEKQATESPETEHPELSPEEQQHLEARKLAEMSGQPGADGGKQAAIERYISYGLRAMEIAKTSPQGSVASPADEVKKNLTDSMKMVADVMTAANKSTVDQLKGVVGLFKFVKDEIISGKEGTLAHAAEKVTEVAE